MLKATLSTRLTECEVCTWDYFPEVFLKERGLCPAHHACFERFSMHLYIYIYILFICIYCLSVYTLLLDKFCIPLSNLFRIFKSTDVLRNTRARSFLENTFFCGSSWVPAFKNCFTGYAYFTSASDRGGGYSNLVYSSGTEIAGTMSSPSNCSKHLHFYHPTV